MIAVLSSNLQQTIQWLMDNYNGAEINKANRTVKTNSGEVYFIVSSFDDAYGREFTGYLVAPNYFNLLDVVKSRIR